ncbi:phage tail sheath family protein [Pelosinus propionicus]|uniref:Phage tail sheath protein n=1 Tax=Pelosinus propionicus DSM 13327 TaxID=1123291 RepID=A0A1I4QD85_9FIRM|nr:phage tail sheath family protein [Pelosinus propionicus]SFM37583.1 Phage tail sheath protein [Pelosinus propionicus DSM 13327]
MAGGTWTTQNKVRPGVYINFKSTAQTLASLGDRGIGTFPMAMSWGPEGEVITLANGEDTFDKLGYYLTDTQMLAIQQFFLGTERTDAPVTLYLWRLKSSGTKAVAMASGLTAAAKYKGVRGNDITVVISVNVDDESKFDVTTIVDNDTQDTQSEVATIGDLVANDWVDFSGTETTALVATTGMVLTDGTDGEVASSAYISYLEAIEPYYYNSMGCMDTSATVIKLFTSYTKRLVTEEGRYAQLVVANYPSADSECVVSIKNGVILDTEDTIPPEMAVAWLVGASAGANVNESLTYATYPGAVGVTTVYTNTEIIAAINAGEFIFTPVKDGTVHAEYDINTFTSYTATKGKSFRKNRIVRVLQGFGNDVHTLFSKYYIGKTDNNDNERSILKAELVAYCNTLVGINALQNFEADDIVVAAGTDSDAVLINANIQPVDSVDKIYIAVTVE